MEAIPPGPEDIPPKMRRYGVCTTSQSLKVKKQQQNLASGRRVGEPAQNTANSRTILYRVQKTAVQNYWKEYVVTGQRQRHQVKHKLDTSHVTCACTCACTCATRPPAPGRPFSIPIRGNGSGLCPLARVAEPRASLAEE